MIGFSFTPQLGIIVGGIAGMLIGWIIGFYDSNNRTAKKIKQAEEKAQVAIREAENRIATVQAQVASTQQVTADDPGLLRLNNEQGQYTLEMDGARVTSVLSPEKRKRLIDLLTIIRPYLEGKLPQPSAPRPAAPVRTPPTSAPVQPATPRPTPPSVQPVTPHSASTATPAPAASTGNKPKEEKPLSALSMVGQIDTVLQARLAGTSLAGRGIRLQDSIQGGVEVYVGLTKYPAVEDVPDEEVKAAIRAAIAEWEKKYTPGL